MEIKAAEGETTFEHTKCSLFLPHPVSLALSQGVIILNGAPCNAISAVKHQRKWIIENMIFWSGGVKESFPLPTVVSPAVHWSVGSLSQSLRRRTTLRYTTLRYGRPDTSSDLSNTSICLSPLHFDRADTLFQKNTLNLTKLRTKKKERKKKGCIYKREEKAWSMWL